MPLGQIERAVRRAFLDDGGHQDVSAPEILVAASGRPGVVGIMQPQGPHDRHPRVVGLADGGVEIGHQPVAELEVAPADRLDLGVVQLGHVGRGGALGAGDDLVRSELAGVPAPGEPGVPDAPVRAERRRERRKLKPAHIELAGELARGREAAGVGSPERRCAQREVDPDRDVRGQGIPEREDVARPDPAAVALHAGVAGSVQAERALAGPSGQRAVEVHPVPGEPRLDRQLVAVVGPPAVHAELRAAPRAWPSMSRSGRGRLVRPPREGSPRARSAGASFTCRITLKCCACSRPRISVGLVEDLGVEVERAVPGIPAGGRVARSQIDQGIASGASCGETLPRSRAPRPARPGSDGFACSPAPTSAAWPACR